MSKQETPRGMLYCIKHSSAERVADRRKARANVPGIRGKQDQNATERNKRKKKFLHAQIEKKTDAEMLHRKEKGPHETFVRAVLL
jgi:hypothetical protein